MDMVHYFATCVFLSNSSVSEQGSGNIFKRIDPTADNSEEIELNPTMSQYDHVIDVSDGTQNQPRSVF